MNFATRRQARFWITFAILFALVLPAHKLSAQNMLTSEQWREDLHYLAEQIPKVNPRVFHRVTRDAFEAAVAGVDAKIATLPDHEIELELVRLVALLGEGHSRISLPGLVDPMSDVPELTPFKDPRLAFHRLPVRLYCFPEGLFVIEATPEYRSLIGARVLQVGGASAESVLDGVTSFVNGDNDMAKRLIAPDFAVIPEVLGALHVIPQASRIQLTFRVATGKEEVMDLPVLPAGTQPKWVTAFDNSRVPRPLYTRRADENLWTVYLEDSKTLWLRINVIQDLPHESVAKFAREIDALAAQHPVGRFVIDLRGCHGGDNQKFRSLLLEIVRNPTINQPGKIFAVIDRGTFSAAVNASSDLERLSSAIFVGEATAGAPNSWGDPRKITLPNSGLIARISTVYWRDWTSDESRPWLAPDLPVAVSAADYFRGRDPVMDAILGFPTLTAFGDLLDSIVRKGADIGTIVRLYYQHKTDAVWAEESTEQPMQRVGALLVSRKSYPAAFVVFQINAKDYPDSLPSAIETVKKASASNPDDQALLDLLRKLRSMNGRE